LLIAFDAVNVMPLGFRARLPEQASDSIEATVAKELGFCSRFLRTA
jgi:hypothetical protein